MIFSAGALLSVKAGLLGAKTGFLSKVGGGIVSSAKELLKDPGALFNKIKGVLSGGIKGLLDGSSHRNRVTKDRVESRVQTFENSSKTLADANAFLRTMYELFAYESKNKGDAEKMVSAAVQPLEAKLKSEGYVSEWLVSNKDNARYPVYSVPVSTQVKQIVTGERAQGGMGAFAMAGIGFLAFKLLKNK